MKASKKKKLEQAGFSIGDAQDFLELSQEERALLELKLSLTDMLKKLRLRQGLTQQELADRLASSQSRIAQMESGAADVTIDLVCKALFALGASPRDLARAIAPRAA